MSPEKISPQDKYVVFYVQKKEWLTRQQIEEAYRLYQQSPAKKNRAFGPFLLQNLLSDDQKKEICSHLEKKGSPSAQDTLPINFPLPVVSPQNENSSSAVKTLPCDPLPPKKRDNQEFSWPPLHQTENTEQWSSTDLLKPFQKDSKEELLASTQIWSDFTSKNKHALSDILHDLLLREKLEALGKYKIIRELGQGNMGQVLLVEDPDRGPLALKLMLASAAEKSALNEDRFFREIKAMERMDHPNIVSIYDYGTIKTINYFTMDCISGQPLSSILQKEKKLPSRKAARLMIKIARAIHYAHTKNIIHRDIKPGNIMINSQNEPIVMDFGLARPLRDAQKLSQTGAILGTPAYMAPEQAEGKTDQIDERTDVYALGTTLYQMIAGQTPFSGRDPMSILFKVIDSPILPPQKINPLVPLELQEVCLKALAKKKEDRYPSAEEMAQDLQFFLEGEKLPKLNNSKKPKRTYYAVFLLFVVCNFVFFMVFSTKSKKQTNLIERKENIKNTESKWKKPPGWPKNLWNKSWNQKSKLLDFTSEEWEHISYSEKIRYAEEYQINYAYTLGFPRETTFTTNKIKITMLFVPPGIFWMGSPKGEEEKKKNEKRYKTKIARWFWISKHEITQHQWYSVTTKKTWKQNQIIDWTNLPVYNVSWSDINKDFIPYLGKHFSLPTEIQWEYACRAGMFSRFHWGNSSKDIWKYAIVNRSKNDFVCVDKVGSKIPNAFGIHDMLGNLWEWCHDQYAENPLEKNELETNEMIIRGGCWNDNKVTRIRCSYRGKEAKYNKSDIIGFRLVINPEQTTSSNKKEQ